MTDSFHRIGNGLFIDDISLIKINGHAKTFPYQCLQYLNLNFSHELHFNLPQCLIPVEYEALAPRLPGSAGFQAAVPDHSLLAMSVYNSVPVPVPAH